MGRILDFPTLRGDQLLELQRLLRSRWTPAGQFQRAYLIWNLAAGYPLVAAAQFSHLHYTNAHKWMRRYLEKGLTGLTDLPRSGRPHDYDPEVHTLILKTATARPSDLDLPFQSWSLARLEDYLRVQMPGSHLSRETIRRILRRHGLRFRLGKTWCQSEDPDFEVKKTSS